MLEATKQNCWNIEQKSNFLSSNAWYQSCWDSPEGYRQVPKWILHWETGVCVCVFLLYELQIFSREALLKVIDNSFDSILSIELLPGFDWIIPCAPPGNMTWTPLVFYSNLLIRDRSSSSMKHIFQTWTGFTFKLSLALNCW